MSSKLPAVCASLCSPNRMSRALERSPSGPAIAVSVCPHRGPGAVPTMGKLLGLGTGSGRESACILARRSGREGDDLRSCSTL